MACIGLPGADTGANADANSTPATMPTTDGCTEHCKHVVRGKRKQHDMIQCTSCARWYHNDCVGVKKVDVIGIWPCPSCREMPTQIRELKLMMASLMKNLDTITTTNSTIINQLKEKDDGYKLLMKENQRLAAENAKLTTRLSRKAWEAFTSQPARLIGDSLLRDIDENIIQKTKVTSLAGANIVDITEHLTNDAAHYRQVVICVGTNNCADDIDIDQLTQQYEELVRVAADKVSSTDDIIISSVPPRTDKVERQRHVEELNSLLQDLATKVGARYISHDLSFRLADGQPNDGYLLADGLHLSNRGCNRLVLNLGLTTTKSDVTKRKKHRRDDKNNNIQHDYDDDTSHSFWQHAKGKVTRHLRRNDNNKNIKQDQHANTKATRHSMRSTQPQPQQSRLNTKGRRVPENNERNFDWGNCDFCAEPGHSTAQYGFNDYAICRQCGQQGHKQKLCAYYRD